MLVHWRSSLTGGPAELGRRWSGVRLACGNRAGEPHHESYGSTDPMRVR